jgi:hypothetical protein
MESLWAEAVTPCGNTLFRPPLVRQPENSTHDIVVGAGQLVRKNGLDGLLRQPTI